MEPRDPAVAGDSCELDGDNSLIRWMMGLSPAERLQVLQGFVDSIGELSRDQSAAIQTGVTPIGTAPRLQGCSRAKRSARKSTKPRTFAERCRRLG